MAIIIGGSGSTGSSLLKTMLNRHTQIFSGPETCLFAYPKVYDNWYLQKKNILNAIFTDGWVIRKGMNLLQPTYGWTKEEIEKAILDADTFKAFVQIFFEKTLSLHHKKYWIEKTPVNAYGFRAFLRHYSTGKVIQIVRDPYDTIASLVARGMSIYYAVGYYVYNTAVASSSYGDERYYQLSYEDVVTQPIATLRGLFNFLDLPFEEAIIQPQNEVRSEPTTMQGWKHHETAIIKSSSIGRFQELSAKQQLLIKTTFEKFQIDPTYRKKHQILFKDGASLCEFLGYQYLSPSQNTSIYPLKKMYWKDRLSRINYLGWKEGRTYPGSWK